jgi:hypothetical protein
VGGWDSADLEQIMTVPVGIATFFFFPDTPYKKKPWFLTDEEHELAVKRVQNVGIAAPAKITWQTFTRILGRWRIYAFVFGYVVSFDGFPSDDGLLLTLCSCMVALPWLVASSVSGSGPRASPWWTRTSFLRGLG